MIVLLLEPMRVERRQIEKESTIWQCIFEHHILGNTQDMDAVEVSHYTEHWIVVFDCERWLWKDAKREEMVGEFNCCID